VGNWGKATNQHSLSMAVKQSFRLSDIDQRQRTVSEIDSQMLTNPGWSLNQLRSVKWWIVRWEWESKSQWDSLKIQISARSQARIEAIRVNEKLSTQWKHWKVWMYNLHHRALASHSTWQSCPKHFLSSKIESIHNQSYFVRKHNSQQRS
jgi:hypothetical protein